jgi:Na+-translocating ferredoxin:NAD+ oxidoreductase RnfC subunit
MTLADIEACGIIGAGGAGFPAHVKLNSRPDTLIVNAAECEPLLHKDMEIILNRCGTVLAGLQRAMEVTGAREAIIGIKEKHHHEIELLRKNVAGNVTVMPVEDVYPAGDEITLIYMTTRRIVAPGALPISVGCVVQNVETLYNIGAGVPVVDKFIAVAGAVEQPATMTVPIGTTFAEILSRFTITEPRYVVRSGGLMMGALEHDLQKVVSKRTGALIVLPEDHHCVTMYNRFLTDHDTDRIAKAGCDQCSFCTELCPRYLLGQPVRPETAMRNRMFTREGDPMVFAGNFSCCECNLCTMYSCPEGLDPRGATVIEKRLAREQKLSLTTGPTEVHPMYDYRKVPTHKLKQRLDVLRFRDEGPLKPFGAIPSVVRVPLREHLGAPAEPVVSSGQPVRRGDLIGRASGKVSSNAHASIDGVVKRVTADEIVLEKA